MIQRFGEFISEERSPFEVRHNNMLATSLSPVWRYRQFLEVVVDRYRERPDAWCECTVHSWLT